MRNIEIPAIRFNGITNPALTRQVEHTEALQTWCGYSAVPLRGDRGGQHNNGWPCRRIELRPYSAPLILDRSGTERDLLHLSGAPRPKGRSYRPDG